MEKIPVVQDYTPEPDGKLHVRLTEGRFQNLRRLTSWPLMALYFALVWGQINGEPLLLFSFEQHRILFFGNAISWRDLSLLAGLLIAAASLLFFLAVAWGRVWCGFACPQSIWTWMFIRIEDFTEGKAHTRAREARLPLSGSLIVRRLLKHLLWSALALATAVTFVGYFVPIRELFADATQLQLSADTWTWVLIIALLTYLNAGLVREKICLHACPYARFQSVMFDSDTHTVCYDKDRGEPRASRRKGDGNEGDCVDCGICQQVCPTGIDIRNGLQAACIDCGACIDACDQVMTKLERPTGLIRFTSEAQLTGEPSHILRPRLAGYGLVMLCAFTGVIYGFTDTTKLLVEIRRDRTALFTRIDRHTVCNNYQIKVEGYEKQQGSVAVSLAEPGRFKIFGAPSIDLGENSATWLPYRVCATAPKHAKMTFAFKFSSGNSVTTKETTFLTRRF
ncbi:cytochrome c oxidase accessory protein CcoG [Microbulbifer sp. HZ11]|uniref:cytochrome c oxidase accessory protein CcoG n=1 Tax=Microbulbifer sp. HZ11 TaxID=1453501 RepID=UPI0005BC71D9|nr:cytochrome c oxidase accessory protein CcoG [Microbulbifer sp. HZ11]